MINVCYPEIRNIYLEAKMKNNLYEVELLKNAETNLVNTAYECKNKDCLKLWHKRLGHRNVNSIKERVKNSLAERIKLNNCNHGTIFETSVRANKNKRCPIFRNNKRTKIRQNA